MAKTKTHVTSISKSRTLEEIAEFWDTHSLADYADQIHEVDIEVRIEHHVENAKNSSSLRDGALPSKQSPRTNRGALRTPALAGGARGKRSQ